jgi:PAS domain S-box-containing protein
MPVAFIKAYSNQQPMWRRSIMIIWLTRMFSGRHTEAPIMHFGVTQRSNRLVNYFLAGYFLLGLVFASFYGTWLIGVGLGGFLLAIYYSVKIAFRASCQYQYVLSVILGVFMAQFTYQMHGMIEMHFFTFIGSALLITYQNWKLQLPMLIFVLLHHILLSYIQSTGNPEVYFSQLGHFDLQTFIIHILLILVIYLICGLCAFQLHQYHQIQLQQAEQMTLLQEAAKISILRQKNTEAMEERNTILESIGDAFFAVDKNWTVTYWNQTAEKVLHKSKKEMLTHNLWTIFNTSIDSKSYRKYHQAIQTNKAVHFEDYFKPLDRWYEISAYPSTSGLSVYFKDITERKKVNADLQESEQRYSDVFHFSPLPMWVADLTSLKFMDVNQATIVHYGYSREEFLTMTLKDIRPPGEFPNMEKALIQAKSETAGITHRQMVHRKKSGELMDIEIQLAPFKFKGVKTSIVIATDITERLLYIKAIEQQNEKLHAISWMQSHVIRAPLARVMGLIPMYIDPKATIKDKQLISEYLTQSANEMDEVIKSITDTTCTIMVKQ